MPSEHTIVVAGVVIAAVLVASALVVERDAWIRQLREHRRLVGRMAVVGLVVIVACVAAAHLDDLETLVALGDVPTVLGAIAFAVGLAAIVAAVLMARIPGDLERRADAVAARHAGALGGLARRLSTVPQVAGN